MEIRPIDANELYTPRNVRKVTEYDETGCGIDYLAVPWEVIQNAPTLDYAPVRHGEWIEDDTPFAKQRKCSICGKRDNPKTAIRGHYCWYCGAKMDAKEE